MQDFSDLGITRAEPYTAEWYQIAASMGAKIDTNNDYNTINTGESAHGNE